MSPWLWWPTIVVVLVVGLYTLRTLRRWQTRKGWRPGDR